jgi:prevent-host-death family protein
MSSPHTPPRHTITAAEFKAKCLKLMDEVEQTGQPLTITKRGKPVARLVPCEASQDKLITPLYGCMKGTGKILGDIMSPMDDIVWNAMHD